MNVAIGRWFILPLGIPAGLAIFTAAPGLVSHAVQFLLVK